MAGVVTLLLAANSNMGFAKDRTKDTTGKPAVVAPIFKHGEGRGVDGCQVVTPPIFLSEQDAMQVIGEELRKAGVTLSQTKVPLKDVSAPHLIEEYKGKQGLVLVMQPGGESKALTLDAFDPQTKVGIEFISARTEADLASEITYPLRNYHLKEVAKFVSESIGEGGHDLYFAAFYDPASKAVLYPMQSQTERDKLLSAARKRSEHLLRMQVKDFVDWLKGQGVI
jgi:hypothetical protein